jgi:hypothetical protein
MYSGRGVGVSVLASPPLLLNCSVASLVWLPRIVGGRGGGGGGGGGLVASYSIPPPLGCAANLSSPHPPYTTGKL